MENSAGVLGYIWYVPVNPNMDIVFDDLPMILEKSLTRGVGICCV